MLLKESIGEGPGRRRPLGKSRKRWWVSTGVDKKYNQVGVKIIIEEAAD